ncbi:MAG: hypothetical protein H3C47_05135 [Candidatus Cloacimonetes bacterium]|nr:hypothetical protein [Candidatus Cloacimonadota bacterium]
MNFSQILKELQDATQFDLYRLYLGLEGLLRDSRRNEAVLQNIYPGLTVEVFLPSKNCSIQAEVLQIVRGKVKVRDISSGLFWMASPYTINLMGVDTRVHMQTKDVGLSRAEVKCGDTLGFRDRQGQEISGVVTKINSKTVTLDCRDKIWRVPFSMLYRILVMDANATLLE